MFNQSFAKNLFLFGSVAGVVCFLYCFVLDVMGIIPLSGKLFPSNLFVLVAMILAVKNYRKHNPDAILHFWEGLVVSVLTASIAAVLLALLMYVYFATAHGQSLIQVFIKQALVEYAGGKAQIVKETNEAYYNSLIAGIKAISPSSIAWSEIKQRPLIAILPSIMISLYFRRQYVK